jgi:nucleoid DNA-binding protein
MKDNFDLSDLIKATEQQLATEQADIGITISTAIEILKKRLAHTGYTELHEFGSLTLKRKAAKSGIDPHGEPYDVPERVKIVFHPFKTFRETVETITGFPVVK